MCRSGVSPSFGGYWAIGDIVTQEFNIAAVSALREILPRWRAVPFPERVRCGEAVVALLSALDELPPEIKPKDVLDLASDLVRFSPGTGEGVNVAAAVAGTQLVNQLRRLGGFPEG